MVSLCKLELEPFCEGFGFGRSIVFACDYHMHVFKSHILVVFGS